MKDVIEILNSYGLSVTKTRKAVLYLFMKNKKALTHVDIERKHKGFDRVTVYRVLQTFVEAGIIHVIPTKGDSILYSLSEDKGNQVHFICNGCGKTMYLDIDMPVIKLPKGFKEERTELVIYGKCDKCSKKI